MKLEKRVKDYLLKNQLVQQGDTVLLGVSGGPDSVAMVHLFNSFKYELGMKLFLAHYNHRLRKSSDSDEQFVHSLAEELNLPLIAESCTHKIAQLKGSVEELAREHRFVFLQKTARKIQADEIALAHTKDDLSETVLMRILRGTGLQGLRSILPKRRIGNHFFIRPLLGLTKEELLAYLKKEGLSYQIDPTNKETVYLRNKIRLKLMPLLQKEYNANIQETLANVSETIACDYDYIRQQAQKVYKRLAKIPKNLSFVEFPLAQIQKQPLSIQRFLFRLAVTTLKGDTKTLTLKHSKEIESLILTKPSGTIVHLPQKMAVKKSQSKIRFYIV